MISGQEKEEEEEEEKEEEEGGRGMNTRVGLEGELE